MKTKLLSRPVLLVSFYHLLSLSLYNSLILYFTPSLYIARSFSLFLPLVFRSLCLWFSTLSASGCPLSLPLVSNSYYVFSHSLYLFSHFLSSEFCTVSVLRSASISLSASASLALLQFLRNSFCFSNRIVAKLRHFRKLSLISNGPFTCSFALPFYFILSTKKPQKVNNLETL